MHNYSLVRQSSKVCRTQRRNRYSKNKNATLTAIMYNWATLYSSTLNGRGIRYSLMSIATEICSSGKLQLIAGKVISTRKRETDIIFTSSNAIKWTSWWRKITMLHVHWMSRAEFALSLIPKVIQLHLLHCRLPKPLVCAFKFNEAFCLLQTNRNPFALLSSWHH